MKPIFFLFFLFSSVVAAEPLVIKFSHGDEFSTPRAKMAEHFQSLIQKRLGDDVARVDITMNRVLLSDDNAVVALEKGEIDMAMPTVSSLQKYNSRFKLFDLPFLFVSPDAAYKFVQGEYGQRFVRLVSQSGFVGFGFLNHGMQQFSADDVVMKPRDLRKLRINAIGSDVVDQEMKVFRAEVRKFIDPELYELLKANEVDALVSTWPAIYTNKFYEHQSYILESNHRYLGSMVLSSQKFWEKIPVDIKPIIEKSLKESIDYGNAIALEYEQANRLNVIATKKTEIHSITVAERRLWVNAVQPIWASYESEIGSGLISAAASTR